MRLIDADALKKAICYNMPTRAEVNILVDAMPDAIVRCKDCKHATMTSDGKMCKYCAMDTDDFGDQRDVYHDAEWFCADGERGEV
jgi:hypothetical protein